MLELVAAEPFTLIVKNSRFLAELFPVATQEGARTILAAQKSRWPDIRHVVHAFAIGPQANILGCSDDGEPAGTAGRPALEVLKGSGVTNVLLTIARWFGGTKLGTGGLVHAYGDAARGKEIASHKANLMSIPDYVKTVKGLNRTLESAEVIGK